MSLGATNKTFKDTIGYGKDFRTPIWTGVLWFYTGGMYKRKLDCVYYAKKYIDFLLGLELTASWPTSLFKELEGLGYKYKE